MWRYLLELSCDYLTCLTPKKSYFLSSFVLSAVASHRGTTTFSLLSFVLSLFTHKKAILVRFIELERGCFFWGGRGLHVSNCVFTSTLICHAGSPTKTIRLHIQNYLVEWLKNLKRWLVKNHQNKINIFIILKLFLAHN